MAGEGQSTVKLLLSLSLLAVLLGGIQAAYRIKSCMKGSITFYEDTNPTLECEGINKDHNIYWSIFDTEDNEVRIGACNTDKRCYNVANSDYNLTRPSSGKSILQIQHKIRQKDGHKIKCSQRNNVSKDFCTLDIISYTIPICESGNVTFREGEITTLQCVGMHGRQNMYWSVYDEDGNEVRIGDCGTNRQCTGVTDSDYNLTRPSGNMSELTIQGNSRKKSGKTIKCSQKLNQTEALCTLNVTYYKIRGCESGNVTFYEEENPELKCYGIDEQQNIYWSIIDDEEKEVRIGDCNTTQPCYGFNSSEYQLTRPSPEESVLKIKLNIGKKNGHEIKCSQRKNDTQALCRLDIISYTIPKCESGSIDIREGEVTTLQCVGMHGLHNMYWSVFDEDGKEVRIGDCGTDRQCTGVTDSDYNPTRPSGNMSELTIQGNYREKSGKTIKCSQKMNQTETLCTLNVIYPGTLSSCWVTASVETWMIHGSCFVDKIFSSVDNYTCSWNQRSDQGDLKIAGAFNLSEFEEGGKSYYRGNCSISHGLPSADGRYQYNVTVQPGSQTETQDAGQVDIEYPKDPSVNCSEFAVENNTHFCQCTASTTKPEKPAPSVSWPNVSDTSDLKLPSVRRGDNGTVYTCQLTWGPDQNIVKTTYYTLQVAYGPDAVIIESENIMNRTTLTCHVDHINPPATFNWTGVVCDSQDENQTHTVCVFEPTDDDDGKLVTCTATNVQTGLKVSDTVRINLTEAAGSADFDTAQAFPTTAVAGGAGAAVVIIIVVVIVLVIISRRKKRAAAKQSALNNGDDDDFVEMHVNDVYGLGDTTNDDPNQVKTSTKPMAAAWRVPPTSSITEPGKPTSRQVFSTSNGDTPYMNLQEHAGVTGVEDGDQYAVVGEEINTEHIEGPKGDVYAVVHKTNKKQETPEHGVHFQVATEPSSSPGEEGSGQGETNVISPPRDVYAEVDKSSKGANTDHNFEKQTDEKKNREQPKVDPKTSKPIAKPRTTMETEPSIAGNGTAPASHLVSPGMRAAGESYENVTMSSSELPSLGKPYVTKTTDVDDEYNTLMLAGRNPTESDEPNPEYSHIGAA